MKIGFVNDGQADTGNNSGQWNIAKATADYANAYLNGINGHVIVMDHCQTNYTASGGTQCGLQMVRDKVAAVLAPNSSEDKFVFAGTSKAGIPYVAQASADPGITGAPGGYVIENGLNALAAELQIAKAKGIKKAGIVIIDVPAAAGVGPITVPMFAKAGIKQDFIPIAASVPDQTGRLQQAIGSGTGAFTISGTDTFLVASLRALKQLQFKGPIVLGQPLSKADVAGVPGGVADVISVLAQTSDPTDPDVKLEAAVASKFATGVTGVFPEVGFVSVLSLVRALNGHANAIDAKTITATLSHMTTPVKLPMGGGITFQCGQKLVSITPNVCTTQYLTATLDANGNPSGFRLGDAKSLFAS